MGYSLSKINQKYTNRNEFLRLHSAPFDLQINPYQIFQWRLSMEDPLYLVKRSTFQPQSAKTIPQHENILQKYGTTQIRGKFFSGYENIPTLVDNLVLIFNKQTGRSNAICILQTLVRVYSFLWRQTQGVGIDIAGLNICVEKPKSPQDKLIIKVYPPELTICQSQKHQYKNRIKDLGFSLLIYYAPYKDNIGLDLINFIKFRMFYNQNQGKQEWEFLEQQCNQFKTNSNQVISYFKIQTQVNKRQQEKRIQEQRRIQQQKRKQSTQLEVYAYDDERNTNLQSSDSFMRPVSLIQRDYIEKIRLNLYPINDQQQKVTDYHQQRQQINELKDNLTSEPILEQIFNNNNNDDKINPQNNDNIFGNLLVPPSMLNINEISMISQVQSQQNSNMQSFLHQQQDLQKQQPKQSQLKAQLQSRLRLQDLSSLAISPSQPPSQSQLRLLNTLSKSSIKQSVSIREINGLQTIVPKQDKKQNQSPSEFSPFTHISQFNTNNSCEEQNLFDYGERIVSDRKITNFNINQMGFSGQAFVDSQSKQNILQKRQMPNNMIKQQQEPVNSSLEYSRSQEGTDSIIKEKLFEKKKYPDINLCCGKEADKKYFKIK